MTSTPACSPDGATDPVSVVPSRVGRARLPLPTLAALLGEHPAWVSAFEQRVWTASGPRGHWFWLGAISDSGHGKIQLGSRSGGAEIVALTHRVAWVLGGGDCDTDAVIRHDCDESSCANIMCLRRGSMADNSADWVTRRHRTGGPLSDRRGLAGRARAVRDAIRAAGADVQAQIEGAHAAAMAGEPDDRQLELIAGLRATQPPIPTGPLPPWLPPPVIDQRQLW